MLNSNYRSQEEQLRLIAKEHNIPPYTVHEIKTSDPDGFRDFLIRLRDAIIDIEVSNVEIPDYPPDEVI